MNQHSFQELSQKTEAGVWIHFCSQHANPVLKEVACFLSVRYEIRLPTSEANHLALDEEKLTPLEVLEALNWQMYFEEHSHPALNDVALCMSEWINLEV